MTLRVATYNLYLGADLSLLFGVPEEGMADVVTTLLDQLSVTDFPTRARAIARLLVDADVELVGLQEVTRWTRAGDVLCDFLAELTSALEDAGGAYDVHAVNRNFAGAGADMTVEGSNVTLVRRELVVLSEQVGDFADALTVTTPMGDVSIRRSWGLVDVEAVGRQLRFVNTHTEAYDVDVRNAQRDELLASVGEVTPCVIVGDFNATPDRVGLGAPYADAWIAAGGDPAGGLTCGQAADLRNEVSALAERIDYVWVRDATVEACRLIGAEPSDRTPTGLWPSDHAGVLAEVDLR
ncbi:MAG TPA: endonuclease/exonuclease/phosphatase family protein [Nocardioidaceae bacterium]|nr:endonuclease/exonuclease/phosphatase family protein [Nocardioidaceae bacterium]